MKKVVFMSKLLVFASLFSVILINQTGCHPEEHKEEEKSTFLVTSAVRMDTLISKDYVCQIHAVQHIELRALESGYLQEIFVDEGQYVKKGQQMFQIMPMMYEAELHKAQAEVEFAEIEYNNTKILADSNVVSENELALAKAKLNKAKAELAVAEVHLGFTEIKAPFSGIMDRFHVRLGSLLEEGELLTELSDNSEMWVYFNVPEAEYLDYKKNTRKENGQEVKLILANGQEFDHSGKITTIEADFDSRTGNIAFRATFPNPERLLRHGETGNVQMTIPLKNALLIPQKATYEVLDKKYVFVVGEDNVIRSRHIKIAEEMPHLYAIEEGLTESDKILLEGLRKVKSGEEIMYDFIRPEEALSSLELYAE